MQNAPLNLSLLAAGGKAWGATQYPVWGATGALHARLTSRSVGAVVFIAAAICLINFMNGANITTPGR